MTIVSKPCWGRFECTNHRTVIVNNVNYTIGRCSKNCRRRDPFRAFGNMPEWITRLMRSFDSRQVGWNDDHYLCPSPPQDHPCLKPSPGGTVETSTIGTVDEPVIGDIP